MGLDKLRDKFKRFDIGRSNGSGPASEAKDLPLDHQLVFNRNPQERWSYDQDGRISVNGEDVEELLKSNPNDVRFQSAVSEAVDEYRDVVRGKGDPRFAKFAARVDGIQTGILSNMKRIYDEKTGGLSLKWGDGGFLMNNLNVRAMLAMYHMRPTPQAQRFLKGLLSKLSLILMNRNGSPHFERVNNVVKSLYNEVSSAINSTPIDVPYVSSGSDDRDC